MIALHKNILALSGVVVAALSAAVLLSCTGPYNPFADKANIGFELVESSLKTGDTIDVFSTETLTVLITVKEHVDQFSIEATGNRYWTYGDTTILPERFDDDPFTFLFSFTDTGEQKIFLRALRRDGVLDTDTLVFHVRSQVIGEDVVAFVGDPVTLRTSAVKDRDVGYYWSFGAGTLFFSQVCSTRVVATSALFSGKGGVWVSDGIQKTPADSFSFVLRDTTPPVLSVANEYYVGKDTVFTADTLFNLKINISDNSAMSIDTASVNGTSFDFVEGNLYYALLNDMHLYDASNPRRAIVYALDRFMFGNDALDTFYVVYSDTAPRSDPIRIAFQVPKNDSAVVSGRQQTIAGVVVNNTLDTVALTLVLYVNDGAPRAAVLDESDLSWQWSVELDSGYNSLRISATDNVRGTVIATETRTIIRGPDEPDTVGPQILQISADGVDADGYYTRRATVVIGVRAVDQGVGIDTVLVNGQRATPAAEASWFYDTVELEHLAAGNEIVVMARDSVGNSSLASVVVFRNRVAAIQRMPASAYIETDTLYFDSVGAVDPDGDSLTYEYQGAVSGPSVDQEGRISWTPLLGDTGIHAITIRVWDGFEPAFVSYNLYVFEKGTIPPSRVSFATTTEDFPVYLEVGQDVLNVALQVKGGSGVPPFTYFARNEETGQTFLNYVSTNVVSWTPTLNDTGYNQLVVKVRDDIPREDVLYPRILVVPPNRPCSISVSFTSDTLNSMTADLNGLQRKDTLIFRIHDPDHPLTERHDIKLSQARTLTTTHIDSALSDTFTVIVDPRAFDGYDTLSVDVTDRGGNMTTIHLALYYGLAPDSIARVYPPYDTTLQTSSVELAWQGFDPDNDSLTYDVYLGFNENLLIKVSTTGDTTFTYSSLTPSQAYYWQVISRDWKSSYTGPIWKFNTQ